MPDFRSLHWYLPFLRSLSETHDRANLREIVVLMMEKVWPTQRPMVGLELGQALFIKALWGYTGSQ